MSTTPFSVRIDDGVREKLEEICALTDRSKAYVTAKAIEEYVERNSWKVNALNRAKAKADEGEFISQEAMQAWAESLGTEQPLADPVADVFKKPV